MTLGAVVYVAWGIPSVTEALKSLASFKEHTPDVVSYLLTDQEDVDDFDMVVPLRIERTRPMTKVCGLLRAITAIVEDRAIFLDTDTIVIEDVSDLFTALNYYDLAIAHAPFRSVKKNRCNTAMSVFNSGVIGFSVYSPFVANLFYEWAVGVIGEDADQFVLSELIHKEYAQVMDGILVLPPEYNLRTGWAECVQGPVRILHGRHNLDEIAEVINEKPGQRRAWVPRKGMVYK